MDHLIRHKLFLVSLVILTEDQISASLEWPQKNKMFVNQVLDDHLTNVVSVYSLPWM